MPDSLILPLNPRPFPFHALGYSRNPFGALSDAEWVAAAVLPDVLEKAAAGNAHLQILGPKGAGKSTTLRKITAMLQEMGTHAVYEYIPEGQRHFTTPLNELAVFCLDEGQRLRWRELRRLLHWGRSQGRLILGTHRRVDWPGVVRPSFTTFHLPDLITAQHWQNAIEQRLAIFAQPEEPRLALSPAAVTFLFHTFGANMREGEYFLYEVWQQQKAVSMLTAEELNAWWQVYRKKLPG